MIREQLRLTSPYIERGIKILTSMKDYEKIEYATLEEEVRVLKRLSLAAYIMMKYIQGKIVEENDEALADTIRGIPI